MSGSTGFTASVDGFGPQWMFGCLRVNLVSDGRYDITRALYLTPSGRTSHQIQRAKERLHQFTHQRPNSSKWWVFVTPPAFCCRGMNKGISDLIFYPPFIFFLMSCVVVLCIQSQWSSVSVLMLESESMNGDAIPFLHLQILFVI